MCFYMLDAICCIHRSSAVWRLSWTTIVTESLNHRNCFSVILILSYHSFVVGFINHVYSILSHLVQPLDLSVVLSCVATAGNLWPDQGRSEGSCWWWNEWSVGIHRWAGRLNGLHHFQLQQHLRRRSRHLAEWALRQACGLVSIENAPLSFLTKTRPTCFREAGLGLLKSAVYIESPNVKMNCCESPNRGSCFNLNSKQYMCGNWALAPRWHVYPQQGEAFYWFLTSLCNTID